jgi:GNAT superfamily N-acetyltransferase
VVERLLLAVRDDGLEVSLDPARLDVDRIHHWLSEDAYWALGRSRDVVERSLAGSLVAGVYEGPAPDGQLVALARVVTDNATFAWICDVYVADGWRGRGVGTWLTEVLVDELVEQRGVLRLLLATRDAHAVYAKAGFEPLVGVWRWMEIDRRPGKDAILAHDPELVVQPERPPDLSR